MIRWFSLETFTKLYLSACFVNLRWAEMVVISRLCWICYRSTLAQWLISNTPKRTHHNFRCGSSMQTRRSDRIYGICTKFFLVYVFFVLASPFSHRLLSSCLVRFGIARAPISQDLINLVCVCACFLAVLVVDFCFVFLFVLLMCVNEHRTWKTTELRPKSTRKVSMLMFGEQSNNNNKNIESFSVFPRF